MSHTATPQAHWYLVSGRYWLTLKWLCSPPLNHISTRYFGSKSLSYFVKFTSYHIDVVSGQLKPVLVIKCFYFNDLVYSVVCAFMFVMSTCECLYLLTWVNHIKYTYSTNSSLTRSKSVNFPANTAILWAHSVLHPLQGKMYSHLVYIGSPVCFNSPEFT